ncbi:hypothetical protein BJ138DRAFT_1020268 [Hygrophoropsis aurantiaca]|uniref:Uncharacterized protein n=1 Tax=Hygrophoropsis aurantiaca TaxID=72124 RepID=A0ACB7ZR66_9AGAM|nr:hypothetical protein BJ138DRAFT_1020268 [Hygrophoropsis aurantiaca]
MRQNVQSEQDARLRTALENMRYKNCTEDDISFLMSRVAGEPPDRPSLQEGKFRNVSIITAWNSQKDRINELGAHRFASDNGRELVEFFSEDKWATTIDRQMGKQTVKKGDLASHKSETISQSDQEMLWSLSPHTSDHIAARLELCVGMPVMIRNNDATELCITKGQEGKVVGWQSSIGSKGQRVLDTLFVLLVNPPSAVQIEGLPPNVVPISKSVNTIPVRLHDDSVRHVQREQVNVLVNYAMTDYAAQGKTRLYNVVDLQHCASHQSYYTCLSRSASADGTVIMQPFDIRKITGGASGWLRQEYRMLEILDEITLLKYEDKLPGFIDGHRRNTLVSLYQQWKGVNHVPQHVHAAIAWSGADPLRIDDSLADTNWEIVDRKKFKEEKRAADLAKFVPIVGTVPVEVKEISLKKRKAENEPINLDTSKRTRLTSPSNDLNIKLLGLKWDSVNYSCAYDSLFTILFHIWLENPHRWNKHMKNFTHFLTQLVKGFQRVHQESIKLELTRDNVRSLLHAHSNIRFPHGPVGASVSDLAHTMLGTERDLPAWVRCHVCGAKVPVSGKIAHVYTPVPAKQISVSDWLQERWQTSNSRLPCTTCNILIGGQWQCDTPPKLIILDVYNQPLILSHTISVKGNKTSSKLLLKGIVYYKNAHFTSAVIQADGILRYHDGMKDQMITDEGVALSSCSNTDLSVSEVGRACLVIYGKLL